MKLDQILIIGIFMQFIHLSNGSQKTVIYNSDSGVQLRDWKPDAKPGHTKKGFTWKTESKRFDVCDVSLVNTFNMLKSPAINLKDLTDIIIEVRFSIRDCLQESKAVKTCANNLTLFYKSGDAEKGIEKAAKRELSAKLITESPLEFSKSDVLELSRTIPLTVQNKYIQLLVEDRGACASLHGVKIYSFHCENHVENLMHFERRAAKVTAQYNIPGKCVPNSVSKLNPQATCSSDGDWKIEKPNIYRLCQCKPGYEPNSVNTKCIACLRNTFKDVKSNENCRPCPERSSTSRLGSRSCECDDGYYYVNLNSTGCFRKPNKPIKLKLSEEDHKLIVRWEAPLGIQPDSYEVSCLTCISNEGFHRKTLTKKVVVSPLVPNTDYHIRVCTHNIVTRANAALPNCADGNITTAKKVIIEGLNVRQHDQTSVLLEWNTPQVDIKDSELNYEVNVWRESNLRTLFQTSNDYYIVKGMLDGNYKFQVVLKNDNNIKSPIVHHQFSGNQVFLSLDGKKLGLSVAILTCLILLVLILLLVSVWCYKKRDYMWVDNLHLIDIPTRDDGFKMPCGQSFVDPNYYDSPDRVLTEFTRDLQLHQIEFYDNCDENGKIPLLCDVVKGTIHYHEYDEPVMIKKIKHNASPMEKKAFAVEAAICGQFSHPNVIMLHGTACSENEIIMCLEYASRGTLDYLLKDSLTKCSPLQLIHLLRGIACGMQYLSDTGYVHKVLNAENILVSNASVCKIAGFDTKTSLEFEESMGLNTIYCSLLGWAAPEVILYRKYSTSSDVWAMGTLMWEVLSYGERPFRDWPAADVSKAIESGIRLNPPAGCPQVMHDLMHTCWQTDRNRRNFFCNIRESLETFIRNPSSLEGIVTDKSAYFTQKQPFLQQMPSFPSTSVSDFLSDLRLSQYTQVLNSADYLTVGDLLSVDDSVLEVLGIASAKHRKKILSALTTLRGQYAKIRHVQSTMKDSPVKIYI